MDTKTEAEKERMRGYLLGNLSDEEKARLEERFLGDGAYFEQLSAVEEELIEAYVHRELKEPDRKCFEQYFMESPVQRVRVDRTDVFLQALESARRQESLFASTPPRFPKAIHLRPSRRALGSFLAATALLLAVITSWLLRQQTRLREQINQSQAALQQEYQIEQQLREQEKQAGVQVAQLSEQLRELKSPQLNGVILDAYPSRFTRAADGPAPNELTVPLGGKTITLLLHSSSRKAYPTYRLEIVDAKESVIWQGEGLVRQTTGEYVISLPSELLPPGSYSLHLYAPNHGQRIPVERYRIRMAMPR